MTTNRTKREAVKIVLDKIPDNPFVFVCCGTMRMCPEFNFHCKECRRVSAYIPSGQEITSDGAYWRQTKNFVFILSNPTEETYGKHSIEIMVMGITKEKRIYKKDQRFETSDSSE